MKPTIADSTAPEVRVQIAALAYYPGKLPRPWPHGHWLHDGDPNKCGECYTRGEPAADVSISMIRNSINEWVASSLDEIGPIAFGYSGDETLYHAIRFLEQNVIPKWALEPKLLENPFLNGTQKFEIFAQCCVLASMVDSSPTFN